MQVLNSQTLSHPNVVTIYDLRHDEETGLHYIITEFAEKGSLADRLRQSPKGLPIDEVLHIAMGICSGLAAAHRKGVVHRDIKPGNILLFDIGESRNVPKVSDFGIARAPAVKGLDIPTTGSGVYGTLPYMAPEQLDPDIGVDHRSDLYSLGILLYEVLTGQVPFTGEPQEIFWAHRFLTPKPPRERRPDIPEALDQVVLCALCKESKNRYQSAAGMREALRAVEDIKARKDRQHRFKDLLQQGLGYVEIGKWEQAAEALRQAEALEPEDGQVLEGLRKVRDQQELKRLYDLGVRYMEAEDWEQARECLARVVNRDLNYAGGQAREQLERATKELKQQRSDRDLMVQYRTGMGCFSAQKWEQAVTELEQVVRQNRNFEDAADRLEEARRYVQADQLLEQAERHEEREEWDEAVDSYERVEQLEPPHIDVREKLRQAKKKQAQARHEQQLIDWYNAGVHQETGDLEQARASFQKASDLQRDYKDVAARLAEVERKIKLKQLFDRASECEAACDHEGAIESYQAILDMERYNPEVMSRLVRAQKCAERYARGALGRLAVKVENWWDRRDRRVRVALGVLFGVTVLVLCVRGVIVPTPLLTPTPPTPAVLCFDCWQHGGELDRSVQCEGNQCYIILGKPDYPCYGGVPVGEAWIKRTLEVPQEISPTLSLRYRVFSYDLDLPDLDYFQVAINGEPFPERYGNYEWNEPSCDREPWDSGWQTLTLDLSAYRGKEVEVSFHNVNGTQPHYNTWTYVDNVRIE